MPEIKGIRKCDGAWSIRHSTARKVYHCDDCRRMIFIGDTYWRYYGRMADAVKPFVGRLCNSCHPPEPKEKAA